MKAKKPIREFSSGGIVVKEDGPELKVLLIKDRFRKWTWPKGHIDGDETSIDAAKREIREETGLASIEEISRIGKVDYFFTAEKELIYKTVYVYLFKYSGREKLVIEKEEADDGRWFSERKAIELLEYKGAKTLLRKAIRAYKKRLAVSRRQQSPRERHETRFIR